MSSMGSVSIVHENDKYFHYFDNVTLVTDYALEMLYSAAAPSLARRSVSLMSPTVSTISFFLRTLMIMVIKIY